MISYLRGTVAEKTLSEVILDVGGIGYACGISATTSAALPAPGSDQECLIYTRLQIRDDTMLLYGFSTPEERTVFEHLIAISGVGPKLALGVLSSFSPETLRNVVAAGDEKRMATVPGVGKKMASRMILELKDPLQADALAASGMLQGTGGSQTGHCDALDDAATALLSMGFSAAECDVALRGYDGDPEDSTAALTYALRRLGGAE